MGFNDPAVLLPSNQLAPLFATGPALVYGVPAATIAAPGTIAGNGTFSTPVLLNGGMTHLAGSAQLSQSGSIAIRRYLDNAGVVLVPTAGSPITTTGGTLTTFYVNDGQIFQSFAVDIVNGAGSVGNLTNVNLVLSSR